MPYRSHEPIAIDAFKGLHNQGDPEETPIGYFTDSENLRFVGDRAISVRHGVDKHQSVSAPLGNVVRIYNYVTPTQGNTILALTYDGTTGKIYHVVNAATVFGPVLTIAGMQDFAFVAYGGRAYISPFATFSSGNLTFEKGLPNEFVYVYLGAGSPAELAGGVAPVGTFSVANGTAGHTDAGLHLFAVVFETDTGYLTPPAAFKDFTTVAAFSVSFGITDPIPLGGSNVTKRHIVATKVITGYTGNTTGYQYYFIPDGTIPDNTTTVLSNISFFDADLLEDASYLLDNFEKIPAGAVLSLYHDRMVVCTTFTDISTGWVSFPGEPEAISQTEGIFIVPPDGWPITNAQEMRDILYVFKMGRTVSFADNDDVPATWPLSIVDLALGTTVHGVAVVNDTGSTNVDFLLVASRRGIIIFSGRYVLPELSWVISDFWIVLDLDSRARFIQMVNSAVDQLIYCVLPDKRLLYADYSNGMDPSKMRWEPLRFDFQVNSIALVNTKEILLASDMGHL